jgi:YcaO-like protein with predicted kinase domain
MLPDCAPAHKGFYAGTHRIATPDETLKRVYPFLPAMGITRIADVTGLDVIGIPVVMVCRPNSRSLAVSQGKGLDLAAAKASGVMESIEAYHAEHITSPVKLATYEEMRYTNTLVDVTRLPRGTNIPFDTNLVLPWIEGHDLLNDEPTWVPYEMVHTNYTVSLRTALSGFSATSNGLASGNHRLEAITHGICETVERDASTLWHLLSEDELQKTRLDLRTIRDTECLQIIEKYDRAGVAVAVWETTSDIGIPSFECIITEREDSALRPLFSAEGMGCHPHRTIALLRALTEAAQSRLTAISGSRDDLLERDYERTQSSEIRRFNRELMECNGPMRNFADGPSWESGTLNEDVQWELAQLRSAGIEQAIVVDLTKPAFKIPVVRVVIPGLEAANTTPDYVPGTRARARPYYVPGARARARRLEQI